MERPTPTRTLPRRQFLRYLGAVGLTATAALAAACQPGSGSAPAAGGAAPAGTSGPASGSASTQLKVWIAGSPELDAAMNKILQQYMAEKPNVKITMESFPFAQYYQKLITSFAGGTGPDVYWVDVRTAEFAKRGALLPIDKYVTKEWTDDVFPIALKEGEWNGTRYAVPMHELANGMFVNKQVFQQAGIAIPHDIKDGWTWDQFHDYAVKLTERSGGATTRWGFGSQRDPSDWTVLPIIQQNGGQALSPDYKKATGYLDAPPSVEALTWYGKLYTDDKVASAGLPPDAFPTGKVAIFDAVSTYVIPLKNQAPDFQYDVAPALKKKQGAVMTGGYNVGISSAAKQADLCWDLVDYMTRVKHAQWALESGYLPCRKSVIAANPMYQEHPWKLFLDELDQEPIHRPATPEYSFFADTFQAAVKDIITGADVKATVQKAAAALDQRLANA